MIINYDYHYNSSFYFFNYEYDFLLLLLGVGTIPVSFYWKILFIIHAGCGYLS